MSRPLTLALAAGSVLCAATAMAAGPVALVEDASGPSAQVGVMDYLSEGQTITLPKGASITIGYFASCLRETIDGGIVRIGKSESVVEAGTVAREKVECDGGRMLLSAEQSKKSGVIAFRGLVPGQKLPEPQMILYGASPVFEVEKPGPVTVQRLDRAAASIELKPNKKQLYKKRFYDFARLDRTLEPGGLYRVSGGGRSIIFRVDPQAKPGAGALIGRLVRL